MRNAPARPSRPSNNFRGQSSIRLRGFPSQSTINLRANVPSDNEGTESGRRRSASDPQRTYLNEPGNGGPGSRRGGLAATLGHEPLPEIEEGAPITLDPEPVPETSTAPAEKKKRLRKYRGRLFRKSSNGSISTVPPNAAQEEYDSGLIDVLDLVGM